MINSKKSFCLLYFLLGVFLIAGISCKKSGMSTPGGGGPVVPPVPVWDVNALRGAWVTTAASTALDSRANIKQCVQTCKLAHQ